MIETGPTEKIFSHPERTETARYIGGELDPTAAS